MKLIVKYKPSLSDFVKAEVKNLEELSPGVGLVDDDYKDLMINSALLDLIGLFIGYSSSVNELKSFNFKDLIQSNESFKVKCSLRSVCVELGQMIKNSAECSVSLDNPDKTIIVEELNNKFLTYLLLVKDLTHRGYAVSNTEFITSDTARVMVDYSGWSDNGLLLDPFCHQGYIIIEAGLKGSGFGPGRLKAKDLGFEAGPAKLKRLKSKLYCLSTDMSGLKFAKQSSKLAGLFKQIKFMFHDLEDLDYKMKEDSIDYVITALPKKINVEKLFFQLDYIMKKNGVLVILTNADVNVSSQYGFEQVNTLIIEGKKMVKLVKR